MLAALLLSISMLADPRVAQAPGVPASRPRPGVWCAELTSPGGPLRFEMRLVPRPEDGPWTAEIHNGAETILVPDLRFEGDEIVLDLAHYDATLRARAEGEGQTLAGHWRKQSIGGRVVELPFRATKSSATGPAWCPPPAPPSVSTELFTGHFSARFSDSSDPAVAVFEPLDDGRVQGTFLTTTGDYRYLAGSIEGDTLRLSCFDGAHAFLFAARADGEGKLAGDFWSGDRHHETWTAVRDVTAFLPDPYARVQAEKDFGLALRLFPDLDGVERSLAEPAFAGKARIVQLLGSWCPNCHDETAFLAELDQRYREKGLSIVGLAFELSTELERSARQVRRMRARHGATYPVLIAGVADKAQAAQALPVLDRVIAFPTTIFLHGDGRVRAVHSGFSGPATGNEHVRQRAEFERLVEELLAEETSNEDATWKLLGSDMWRDERDGVHVRFGGSGSERTFEAFETTRFDRPTRAEPTAKGSVAISGTSVLLGDAVWHLDRRASVLLDPRDCGHRLVPGARSRVPVVDGAGLAEPSELELELASGDPVRRREALHYLALVAKDGEEEQDFDPVPYLGDPDLGVRAMAAWASGHLALPAAERGLTACLEHPNAGLRREAVRALAKIGTPSALGSLRALEGDLDPLVREAARAPRSH